MRIGIVGAEAAKFTPETEKKAKDNIRGIILANSSLTKADAVVSGQCHLGGIDLWAVEIARDMGLSVIEYPAHWHTWVYGYRPRNIKIAKASDKVYCITLRFLPDSYTGMRFHHCYHCNTPPEHHVKSGGCWTMKFAQNVLHKPTQLIIIE